MIGAAHEYIGNDVLGGARADRGARARMAGAHQRQRAGDLLVGRAQLPAQQRQLALGDELQMMARDLDRGVEPGRRRIELAQLQLDALADGARADAGRVQRLDAGQHGLDLGGVASISGRSVLAISSSDSVR